MEVKKLKRELLAAIAMVLVSVLAFSAATYAWYASSTSVTADGIKINAKTEGTSFEIATRDAEGNAPTLENWPVGQTLATSQIAGDVTLIPVHPEVLTADYDGSDFTTTAEWFHAFSKEYDDANVTTDTTKVTDLAVNSAKGQLENTENAYALVADFYVRLNPTTAGSSATIKDLVAKDIVITDNSTDGNKLSGCVYLLVAGEDGAYEITTTANNEDETAVTAPAESGVIIENITTTNDIHKITVYAFFEGKDEDCKSANYDANGLSISLSFEGVAGTTGD